MLRNTLKNLVPLIKKQIKINNKDFHTQPRVAIKVKSGYQLHTSASVSRNVCVNFLATLSSSSTKRALTTQFHNKTLSPVPDILAQFRTKKRNITGETRPGSEVLKRIIPFHSYKRPKSTSISARGPCSTRFPISPSFYRQKEKQRRRTHSSNPQKEQRGCKVPDSRYVEDDATGPVAYLPIPHYKLDKKPYNAPHLQPYYLSIEGNSPRVEVPVEYFHRKGDTVSDQTSTMEVLARPTTSNMTQKSRERRERNLRSKRFYNTNSSPRTVNLKSTTIKNLMPHSNTDTRSTKLRNPSYVNTNDIDWLDAEIIPSIRKMLKEKPGILNEAWSFNSRQKASSDYVSHPASGQNKLRQIYWPKKRPLTMPQHYRREEGHTKAVEPIFHRPNKKGDRGNCTGYFGPQVTGGNSPGDQKKVEFEDIGRQVELKNIAPASNCHITSDNCADKFQTLENHTANFQSKPNSSSEKKPEEHKNNTKSVESEDYQNKSLMKHQLQAEHNKFDGFSYPSDKQENLINSHQDEKEWLTPYTKEALSGWSHCGAKECPERIQAGPRQNSQNFASPPRQFGVSPNLKPDTDGNDTYGVKFGELAQQYVPPETSHGLFKDRFCEVSWYPPWKTREEAFKRENIGSTQSPEKSKPKENYRKDFDLSTFVNRHPEPASRDPLFFTNKKGKTKPPSGPPLVMKLLHRSRAKLRERNLPSILRELQHTPSFCEPQPFPERLSSPPYSLPPEVKPNTLSETKPEEKRFTYLSERHISDYYINTTSVNPFDHSSLYRRFNGTRDTNVARLSPRLFFQERVARQMEEAEDDD